MFRKESTVTCAALTSLACFPREHGLALAQAGLPVAHALVAAFLIRVVCRVGRGGQAKPRQALGARSQAAVATHVPSMAVALVRGVARAHAVAATLHAVDKGTGGNGVLCEATVAPQACVCVAVPSDVAREALAHAGFRVTCAAVGAGARLSSAPLQNNRTELQHTRQHTQHAKRSGRGWRAADSRGVTYGANRRRSAKNQLLASSLTTDSAD